MYELIQVAEHSYYIDYPAKIGLVRLNDTDVCLIDSGNDKDAARMVLRHLNERGWTLRMILNTHSHADHTGGNAVLAQRTGCAIYAPEGDLSFTRRPEHEPALLYGGCPPKPLRNKFLMARPSDAMPLTPDCLPAGFEMQSMDGHCPAMAAFRSPDGVWYLGDCMTSAETIDRYHVSYLYNVEQYLAALERSKTLEGVCFIPSHVPAMADIRELADYNIRKVHEVAGVVRSLCETPLCFEDILKGVFDHYGLSMSWAQYVLVGSTIRGYLSWLLDRQALEARIEDNRMLWQSI